MRKFIDVSELPHLAFGRRSPLWWATMLLIGIESTMFVLLFVTYLAVRGVELTWPLHSMAPARLDAMLGLLCGLASVPPTVLASLAARRYDLRALRLWLIVATVFIAGLAVFRFLELDGLPFRWYSHAYGSTVWTMLGMHTLHTLTGLVENLVFLALLFRGPVEEKHMVDLDVNSIYWLFVVGALLLVDLFVYVEPLLFAK